jgi:rod shape determining protein RodA
MGRIKGLFSHIDIPALSAAILIVILGLVTMNNFGDVANSFFNKQLIWLALSIFVMVLISFIDVRFLRRTSVIIWMYVITVSILASLFIFGSVFQGSQSWFNLGFFSFQPAELSKLVLVLLLAKYFSKRHVEIKQIRHIIVSGIYAGILFFLIMMQPDFGSALIIFAVWFGMVLFSGLSKKHFISLFATGVVVFGILWASVFADYQKTRILTFLNPLQDLQGAGYNAYQSTISVGSGMIWGKGVGNGTQSRLLFLPEYQTDFVFAAYAEEWGFIGSILLFILYLLLIFRILKIAIHGESNFEILYAIGFSILIMSHVIIHTGINIGLLPVTGITIPFMSYGGTNLLILFSGLGILFAMRKYERPVHKDFISNEFVGPK